MAKLTDVFIDRPIEIIPYINDGNGYSEYIKNHRLMLNAEQAQEFITYIQSTDQQKVIEETLQGLCKRNDGTPLKSAFPSLDDFTIAIKGLNKISFRELHECLYVWKNKGCNEVLLNFEEATSAMPRSTGDLEGLPKEVAEVILANTNTNILLRVKQNGT